MGACIGIELANFLMLELTEKAATLHTAPSFNGRTADSGSAYRGSNPWGAAKLESATYTSSSSRKRLCRNILS